MSPTATRPPQTPEIVEKTIYIGEVLAAREPTIIKTLLGSCVAVCLWDPVTRVGGMNHFLLPRSLQESTDDSARFGVHAMDLLICEMLKAGAERSRLRAKVFGGAHVLAVAEEEDGIPSQNITFALEFLKRDGFKLTGSDLGGYLPRRVHFQTDTGRAFVQRVVSATALSRLTAAESRQAIDKPVYGAVELF
jgi:chemotaxis receptor (MCP) glutamine deamidase CheD